MLGITEHKLERVLARRQFDPCLCLPRAEVEMALVLRNGFVGIQRCIHVDQQMMVPGVFEIIARMRDPHIA